MFFILLILTLLILILLNTHYKHDIFKVMIAGILVILGLFVLGIFWFFVLLALIFSYFFSKFDKTGRTFYKAHSENISEKEARDILGVGEDATEDEINKAFKKLIMINHPDKGGSKYLANKLILARKVLLKKSKGANNDEIK